MQRYFALRYEDYSVHLRELLRQQATAEETALAVGTPCPAMASSAEGITSGLDDSTVDVTTNSLETISEEEEDSISEGTPSTSSESSASHGQTRRNASPDTVMGPKSLADQLVAEPPTDLLTDDAGFGSWALAACQACPRCMVIIRKEVGCDHIYCRCGADFCFSCGAPQGKACVGCKNSSADSRLKHQDLPRLARWLRVEKVIDF
jgi:hypothetical protein